MTTTHSTNLNVGDLVVYVAGKKKNRRIRFGRIVALSPSNGGGVMEIPVAGGTATHWFHPDDVVPIPPEFIDRYFGDAVADADEAAADVGPAPEAECDPVRDAQPPVIGEARTKVDLLRVSHLLITGALLADLSGPAGVSLDEGHVSMAAIFMGLPIGAVAQETRRCASMTGGLHGELLSESVEMASRLLALRLMTLQKEGAE